MILSKVKIGLLLAAHVVGGIAFALYGWQWVKPDFGYDALAALVNADGGLLAIWAGLSRRRLGWRILAVVIATVCDCAVDVLYRGIEVWLALVSAWAFYSYYLIPLIVFGLLSALRFGGRKVRLVHLGKQSPHPRDNQFSIRYLMVATAVVAGVLGICRALQSLNEADKWIWAEVFMLPCVTAQPLVMLWAALGSGRPIVRLCVVVPMAYFVILSLLLYGLGLASSLALDLALQFGLDITITIASLLVVRSCGWRVVWGKHSDKQMTPGDQASGTATAST